MHTFEHLRAALPPTHTPNRPLYVAVTGHCNLGDAETNAFVADAFAMLLAELKQEHRGGVVALSGLAAGADTLFAEAALEEGIPLESCLACADVAANFAPGAERNLHLALRARSRHIHRLPFHECSNTAYMALGRWLVDSCDLLIAAWNGLPAVAEGGTGDVVAYARSQRCPLIHIHTRQRTIAWL